MSRPYCPTPDCCIAKSRGPCLCQIDEEFRTKVKDGMKVKFGTLDIPDHLKTYKAKLQRCGIKGEELKYNLRLAMREKHE